MICSLELGLNFPILSVSLYIHIRFGYDPKSNSRMKFQDSIQVPRRISIPQTARSRGGEDKVTSVDYELVNLVQHIGDTSSSGHYMIDCVTTNTSPPAPDKLSKSGKGNISKGLLLPSINTAVPGPGFNFLGNAIIIINEIHKRKRKMGHGI